MNLNRSGGNFEEKREGNKDGFTTTLPRVYHGFSTGLPRLYINGGYLLGIPGFSKSELN